MLEALEGVIERALEEGSRLGYFAAIYRKVTATVKEGIETGFFDDNERIERLDVSFANRYLSALDLYLRGARPTRSWELAFAAAEEWRPLILQHLLAGINAHINLDLGIAAAEVSPGPDLPGLRRDFDRINEILASLVDEVQEDMNKVSPWIYLLDRIGGRHDEEVIRFSLDVARAEAWRFATELSPLASDTWSGPIAVRDARVGHLARGVLDPGLLGLGLLLIRSRESNDVRRNIMVLNAVPQPSLETVEARVRDQRAVRD